jgi:hypothetical protein
MFQQCDFSCDCSGTQKPSEIQNTENGAIKFLFETNPVSVGANRC